MYLRELSLLAIVTSLTACGGSGSSTTQEPDFTSAQTFAEIDDLQASFGDAIDDADWVSPAILPTSGTAEFVGILGIGTDFVTIDEVFAASEMAIEIDLETDVISGGADNFFRAASGEALVGSVSFDGEILRDVDVDATFGIDGDITGTLEAADGSIGQLDLEVDADLYSDGAFIFGQAEGTALFEDGSSADGVGAAFILERN